MKTKKYHVIGYPELDTLVNRIYPGKQEYSFVETQECGNDSCHTFDNVTKDLPTTKWDKEDVEKIHSGEVPMYRNDIVLKCLVAEGHLPQGNYLVVVSW